MRSDISSGSIAGESRPAQLGLRLTPNSTIALTSPPWIRVIVRRIDSLLDLKADWDKEGALPVAYESAMASITFLLDRAAHDTPVPQIVPTVTGGVQLEWHVGGCDLEVTFLVGSPASFFYVSEDDSEVEGDVVKQGRRLDELIRRLPARDEFANLEH